MATKTVELPNMHVDIQVYDKSKNVTMEMAIHDEELGYDRSQGFLFMNEKPDLVILKLEEMISFIKERVAVSKPEVKDE